MPLSFRWGGYADTDLSFSEYYGADHTLAIHFMPQFPVAYLGPILTSSVEDSFIIGQGDFFSGPNAFGSCPAGGGHDGGSSGIYSLVNNSPGAPGQNNWRWCKKCKALFFGGSASSKCPADSGSHDASGSGDYKLALDNPSAIGQKNWRRCKKCQGLFFGTGPSECPSSGSHDGSGSGDYTLPIDSPSAPGQKDWRWCKKCQGLFFWGDTCKLLAKIAGVSNTQLVSLPRGVWQHVAVVRAGNTFTLYVNGVKLQSGIGAGSTPAGKLRLGRLSSLRHDAGADAQFYGLLDDLAVFKKALTQSEVQALAGNAGHLKGTENNLFAGWNFQSGESQPAVLARPLILSSGAEYLPATFKRDSSNDAATLPLPKPQVAMRLPLPPGEQWYVIQGMDNPFGSHGGYASFCFDFMLAGKPQADTNSRPITSVAPGIVEAVFDNGTSGMNNEGNNVIVRHANDEISGYNHIKQNSAKVKVGDYVDEGQVLALVGDTGAGVGAFHLHFGSGNTLAMEGAITVPAAFSNYEVSTDQGTTWTLIPRGIPRKGEWIKNPTLRSCQGGWKLCLKCRGLFFGEISSGKCFAGGAHDGGAVPGGGGSGSYTLPFNDPVASSQNNWRWCKNCQGLFFGGNASSKCPASGAHDGSGSGDYSLVIDSTGANQHDWRWCKKCQGLFFARNNPGVCISGGTHDGGASGHYSLVVDPTGAPGQNNWRWCKKCQGLFFAGNPSSKCPVDGTHDGSSSLDYSLVHNVGTAPGQQAWRWCKKCQGLFFGDNASSSKCPVSGPHDFGGSGNYSLFMDAPDVPGHQGWRWCKKCQGLFFRGFDASKCPADGGKHDGSGSGEYRLLFGTPGLPPTNLPTQPGWRWCKKCQGLFFGVVPNTCAAGGAHDGKDSIVYAIVDKAIAAPQSDWQWCKKCQSMFFGGGSPSKCATGGAHDGSASSNYSLSLDQASAPGQHNWRWCNKCQSLFFAACNNGICPDGGSHNNTGSGDYALLPSYRN